MNLPGQERGLSAGGERIPSMNAIAPFAGPAGPQTSHRGGRSARNRREADHDLERLGDAAVLELLLQRAGCAGADELALALVRRFGSLAAAVGTSQRALSQVIPAQAAFDLRLLHEMAVRMALAPLHDREVLSSQTAVAAYLKVLLAAKSREEVWVLFLDKRNHLILSEKIAEGTVDHAPVYPREIVRRALELDSSALILVHNHPSGDPTPSRSDIEMTGQVIAACRALGIAVHDHMIVGREQVASLKGLGLM